RPFQTDDVMDLLNQVRDRAPLAPSRLVPTLPRDLETICLKCLAKEPERRYASARDLATDLQRFDAGEPIQARAVTAFERTWKWMKRHPLQTTFMAVSAVAVAALLMSTVALYYMNQLQTQKREAESQREIAQKAEQQAVADRQEAERQSK